jgi:NOL1/NOP2/fmu family ribosome biogenesis protein
MTDIDFMEIAKYLKDEFGVELPANMMFSNERKVFIYTGQDLGLEGRKGIYLGTYDKGFRPSVYTAQLATKGFTELTEKEAYQWMCGLDVLKKAEGYYTIVRFGKYLLGVGKPKETRIINNMPKNRRLPLSCLK